MATATDLGNQSVTPIGYNGQAVGWGSFDAGLATTLPVGYLGVGISWGVSDLGAMTTQSVEGDAVGVIYKMTGFDTVALTTIYWLSYNNLQTPPPTTNPVTTIRGVRIR